MDGRYGQGYYEEPLEGYYEQGRRQDGYVDEQQQAYQPQDAYEEGYGESQRYPQEYSREVDQADYYPPSGAPPPGQYQATGAGYVPPGEQYQQMEPPYGQQEGYPPEPEGQMYEQRDPAGGQVAQQYFEYSNCSGRKKAVLIGINYYGSENQLEGCINDAHNIQQFICDRFGYDPSDIVLLTDDAQDPRSYPSRENIIRAMAWLVDGAQKDDSLFFHYSGHGTQVPDEDGSEPTGEDDAICPVDFQDAGVIIDDDTSYTYLVRPLPAGCRLTAIFDSCHSGTVMDLPYVYTVEGNIAKPDFFAGAEQDLVGAGRAALGGDGRGVMQDLFGIARGAFNAERRDMMHRQNNTSPADVIQWGGCKDSQTSADTEEAGRATGAMSYAFITALTKYPDQSYQQLLETVRDEMRGRYTQVPQLSSCHPIDTELRFVA